MPKRETMIRDTSAQDAVLAPVRGQKLRRRLLWGGGAALAGLLLFGLMAGWRASSQSVQQSRLRLARAAYGDLVRDAAVNGRVVAAVSPTLFAPSAATVTLRVKAGDSVQRGQILAELDSPDLRDQLKREQSLYQQMQAELARQQILAKKQKLLAQREADQSEIERIAAQRTYQRIEQAGGLGVVSKIDFMKAQDALKSTEIRARHAAEAAQLESEDVGLELKTRASQLQRQALARDYAQRRVDALSLRAPMDGIVGSLAVANRSAVAAQSAILSLVDLSQFEVELEIPESYATEIGLGMDVEIAQNGAKVMAKLSALSPEVVKNQVLARARFSAAQPAGLRQNQRIAARLLIEEKKNVLQVARGPFVENEGGRSVYVVEQGVAQRRPIRLGVTSIAAVEILSGLKAGDQVVISGSEAFEHAQRISINPN